MSCSRTQHSDAGEAHVDISSHSEDRSIFGLNLPLLPSLCMREGNALVRGKTMCMFWVLK